MSDSDERVFGSFPIGRPRGDLLEEHDPHSRGKKLWDIKASKLLWLNKSATPFLFFESSFVILFNPFH